MNKHEEDIVKKLENTFNEAFVETGFVNLMNLFDEEEEKIKGENENEC